MNPIKGRGTAENPPNRFEQIHLERDADWNPEEDAAPGTKFFHDKTQSIIAYNDSPDVGFSASINPYRGCEHGCVYCYARPFHEHLGFSAGLDFESRILVKLEAPELLRRELSRSTWVPQVIALSGVTDCYQPAERKFRLTRRCLEVLRDFRNPVCIVTKNHLVTRDIDLISELAGFGAGAVFVSVTTLDRKLPPKLEPRTSLPEHRLAAIQKLSAAGIPVGVLVAPVIPGLTDHEMPRILLAAARAGATQAGYVLLRLPHGVSELFVNWLERHTPERKEKVLNRVRAIRGGALNDPNFWTRMEGNGLFAQQVSRLFEVGCRRAGLNTNRFELSAAAFRRAAKAQLILPL